MIQKPWFGVAAIGPIYRTPEAARYLGMSSSRYYELAERGVVPPVRKIGPRASGVPKAWLDAFIAARFAEPVRS